MNLKSTSLDGETKEIITEVGGLFVSSFGRIYIPYYIKDYQFIAKNKIRISSMEIDIPTPQKSTGISYIYESTRGIKVGKIAEFFNVCSSFLCKLIEKNKDCSFEESLAIVNKIPYNKELKYSLLKPVHYRYQCIRKNNYGGLNKILKNLKNENWNDCTIRYNKMVLYDVPYCIRNSQLIIFEFLKLDISEIFTPHGRHNGAVFNCLSLGEIEKFKRVEIILGDISNICSENLMYGKEIKEIRLII